ncbi:MAG: alpha/beta hydrolase [Actinomycetota bacterium]
MARSSGKARAPQTSTRRKSRSAGSIVGWIVVVLIVLTALFYGGGGWYFSSEVYERAFKVEPIDSSPYDITVDRAEADVVVLRADPEAQYINTDGTFGLISDTEASVVGDILSAETSDGISTVHRSRDPEGPIPPSGTAVRLDPFVWPGDPNTALGIAFQDIEYPIEGGAAAAWYVPGASDTWMIFVHGKGAPKNEALRMLPIAVERGYHAMVIDYRNDPDAPRDPSGEYRYGLTEWKDLTAAGRYAKEHGGKNLILVGYSMGGANVMSYLLQSPLRNQTVAAILDSPMLDFESTVDHGASQETLPLTPITLPESLVATAKWFAGWRFDIDWEALNYVDQWRDLHTPTLIIQGTGDDSVPVEPAHELARIRSDIITLVTPARVGHVLAWNDNPEGYEALINSFLDGLGV